MQSPFPLIRFPFLHAASSIAALLLVAIDSRAQSLALETGAELPDLELNFLSDPAAIDLSTHFTVPGVSGQVVLIQTDLGTIPIEMLANAAPQTVVNFLKYVSDGDYANTMFHRSVPGFIIQSGGFYATLPVTEVPADPPVQNEFSLSNLRGTLSMAKIEGNPDSATSEWFINLANNAANLDIQNSGFTVFARVIGSGMDVADTIAAQSIWDAGGALSDLPLEASFDNTRDLETRDFIAIPTISQASLFPASGQSDSFVAFEVESSDEEIATVDLDGSSLQLRLSQQNAGSTTITVTAVDPNGNEVSQAFDLNLVAPFLNIDLAEVVAESSASEHLVSIESNIPWTIESVPDWIVPSVSAGSENGSVTFAIAKNDGPSARFAAIEIGDQIHRVWQRPELTAFFTPEQLALMEPSPFAADSDGDGIGNGAEIALGSDPTNPNSALFLRIEHSPTSRELIFEPVVEGVTLVLQESENLAKWTNIEDATPQIEGNVSVFSLPNSESSHYRIRFESPLFEEPDS